MCLSFISLHFSPPRLSSLSCFHLTSSICTHLLSSLKLFLLSIHLLFCVQFALALLLNLSAVCVCLRQLCAAVLAPLPVRVSHHTSRSAASSVCLVCVFLAPAFLRQNLPFHSCLPQYSHRVRSVVLASSLDLLSYRSIHHFPLHYFAASCFLSASVYVIWAFLIANKHLATRLLWSKCAPVIFVCIRFSLFLPSASVVSLSLSGWVSVVLLPPLPPCFLLSVLLLCGFMVFVPDSVVCFEFCLAICCAVICIRCSVHVVCPLCVQRCFQ